VVGELDMILGRVANDFDLEPTAFVSRPVLRLPEPDSTVLASPQ